MNSVTGTKKETLKVLGNGTYKREVETTNISISGSATFHENVITEGYHIIGYCKVLGEVVATNFVNKGSSSVKKRLTSNELTNLGKGYFHHIKAEIIDSAGYLEVNESVHCKTFKSRGALKINDTLSGENLSIELSVPSRINKIEGREELSIKFIKSTFLNPFTRSKKKMTSNVISANKIHIEHTEAEHVSGNFVKIGKNCRINEVVYSEGLEVHPSSYVGTKVHK